MRSAQHRRRKSPDGIDIRDEVVDEPGEGDTNQADPVAPKNKAVRDPSVLHRGLFVKRRFGDTWLMLGIHSTGLDDSDHVRRRQRRTARAGITPSPKDVRQTTRRWSNPKIHRRTSGTNAEITK